MSLSKKFKDLRFQMWVKYPVCFVCKLRIEVYSDCSIEHVIPKSLGGKTTSRNLTISHSICNPKRRSLKCPLLWQNPEIAKKIESRKSKSQTMKAWEEKYRLS